jgi:uncharacterized protein
MQLAVVAAGALAVAAGWWFVSSGKGNVWIVTPTVMGCLGVAAVLARRPVWAGNLGGVRSFAVGAASGLALYGATLVFILIVARWERVRSMVAAQYGWAKGTSRLRVIASSLLIVVPAEEVFWRGLVQGRLASTMTVAGASALAWLAYVAATSPARSAPLTAAAVVGGAVWVGLAWWSGGFCASLASHMVWTGLMLIAPPGAARASEDP